MKAYMALRIAVQQEQRRTGTADAQKDLGAGGLDALLGETREKIRQACHQRFCSRATARQPMSERQKPPGQSIAATA